MPMEFKKVTCASGYIPCNVVAEVEGGRVLHVHHECLRMVAHDLTLGESGRTAPRMPQHF